MAKKEKVGSSVKKTRKIKKVIDQPVENTIVDVEEEMKQRVINCTAKINEALKEFKCDFDVVVMLRAGLVMPSIKVVPIEVLQAQQNSQKQPT